MTRAVLVAALIVAASPACADDDEPELMKMRFTERGRELTVTTSVARLFDAKAYENLADGFVATVVIRLWVYKKDRTQPVAFQLVQRRVQYNQWDDVYRVWLDSPGARRSVEVKERSRAFTLVTSLDTLPIAALADIPYEQHHVLAVVAELNPVSKETLAEVRRWLTKGTTGSLDRGTSFFGSFVSVFVNPKIPEADRALRIRSQPFFRPTPKATP